MTPRVPAVVAGVCAIAASLTTIGAIVVSDIAEARESYVEMYSDELAAPAPVTMKPTRIAQEPEPTLIDPFEDEVAQKKASGVRAKKKLARKLIDFGAFEGY